LNIHITNISISSFMPVTVGNGEGYATLPFVYLSVGFINFFSDLDRIFRLDRLRFWYHLKRIRFWTHPETFLSGFLHTPIPFESEQTNFAR